MADGTHIEESTEPAKAGPQPRTADLGAPEQRDVPPAPYPGLRSFRPGDVDRYFGRDDLVDGAVKRFWRALDEPDHSAWLWVVGPSGVGKTSLLQAGLCPRLASLGYERVSLTPGADPMSSLAGALAGHLGADPVTTVSALLDDPAGWLVGQRRSGDTELVLVIDQFEELFLLGASEQRRRQFLSTLATLTAPGGSGRCVVVAGLDIAFYSAVAAEPVLAASLSDTQVLVGPLAGDQLRQAIQEPAWDAGYVVEDGLVELLMAAAAGRDGSGPPALPLMAHALRVTWNGATARTLTAEACQDAGGPLGAVEVSAEAVWAQLDNSERKVARHLVARLAVQNGDQVVAVPLPRSELASVGEPGVVDDVIRRFVAAGLMTVDRTHVGAAHVTLLTAWSRADGWLAGPPRGRRENGEAGRAPSAGLGGTGSGVRSAPAVPKSLPAPGREPDRGPRRTTARLPWLVAAVALVVALTAAVGVVVTGQARDDAEVERDAALARQAVVSAAEIRATDPGLAAELAVAGHALAVTPESRSGLLAVTAQPAPARHLGGSGPAALAAAADSDLVAVGDITDATVQLFTSGGSVLDRAGVIDLTDLPPIPQPEAGDGDESPAVGEGSVGEDPVLELAALAAAPDGDLLAVGDSLGRVSLWDVSDPAGPELTGGPLGDVDGVVHALAISPDGTELAVVGEGVEVLRWSLADPSDPEPLPEVFTLAPPGSVAYHTTLPVMAVGTELGSVQLWSLASSPDLVEDRRPGDTTVGSVAFSPEGDTMAAGSGDGELYVWDIADGFAAAERIDLGEAGFEGPVGTVAFSPDGEYLVVGAAEEVRVWPVTGGEPLADLPHPAEVTGAGFGADGSLLSADADGTTRTWDLGTAVPFQVRGRVHSMAATPDGERLVVASASEAGVWDLDPETGGTPGDLLARVDDSLDGVEGLSGAVDLSPDGDLLALGADDSNEVHLVDLAAPDGPELLGSAAVDPGDAGDDEGRGRSGDAEAEDTADDQAGPGMVAVAFSPDRQLAAAGRNGQVHMWDVRDPVEPELLASAAEADEEPQGLTWSPDGQLLVVAGTESGVHLYAVDRGLDLAAVLDGEHADEGAGARAAAFTSGSDRLVTAGSDDARDSAGTVSVWDVRDPSTPELVAGPLEGLTGTVADVAVSPDDDRVAVVALDGTNWVWNLQDLEELGVSDTEADEGRGAEPWAVLGSGDTLMRVVMFGPDSDVLLAAGDGGLVRSWSLDPEAVATSICAVGGDRITPGEWATHLPGLDYEPPC